MIIYHQNQQILKILFKTLFNIMILLLLTKIIIFKNRIKNLESDVQKSANKLACEELLHSQAYRDFLHEHEKFFKDRTKNIRHFILEITS